MCMTTVTITEARAKLPQLVDEVQAGGEVVLTRHGLPVAVLMRPEAAVRSRHPELAAQVDELHRRLVEARSRPFDPTACSPQWADEMVAAIRADRDAQ